GGAFARAAALVDRDALAVAAHLLLSGHQIGLASVADVAVAVGESGATRDGARGGVAGAMHVAAAAHVVADRRIAEERVAAGTARGRAGALAFVAALGGGRTVAVAAHAAARGGDARVAAKLLHRRGEVDLAPGGAIAVAIRVAVGAGERARA